MTENISFGPECSPWQDPHFCPLDPLPPQDATLAAAVGAISETRRYR